MSCAAAPTRCARQARSSPADTRSSTRNPSTAWPSPARVPRDLIRTTGGAQPGDTIILTKEIGTGVLIGANQQGAVSEEHWNAAVAQMMTLNRDAAEAASDPDLAAGVHAIADVTGFGLAGHLHEMAELSDAAIKIDLGAAPALGGLSEAVAAGFGSGGQSRNREYYGARLTVEGSRELTTFEETLLYDPQTSGGLLIAAGTIEAPHLIHELQQRGVTATPIARVIEPAPNGRLIVKAYGDPPCLGITPSPSGRGLG